MADFPIMLKVCGRRCVVIGGGTVAARRVAALRQAGAAVTIIAPTLVPELAALAEQAAAHVTHVARAYAEGDLAQERGQVALVIVATDDARVNDQVQADAQRLGLLVNRADNPEAGDFTVPAHAHHGPLTLAVHTGGVSAAAAGAIRRQLSSQLDPDWPTLLDAAANYRPTIQQNVTDANQRRQRLRQLTDEQAMNILKTKGPDALKQYHENLTCPIPGS